MSRLRVPVLVHAYPDSLIRWMRQTADSLQDFRLQQLKTVRI